MRKYILLVSVWFISLNISAQDIAINRQINALKRDTTLIYAEATMEKLKDAETNANTIFNMKLSEWVKLQYDMDLSDVELREIRLHRKEIQMMRYYLYRVFVYISKDSIKVEHPEPEIKEEKIMLNEEELEMVTLDSFYKIEPYIKLLESKGKLKAYGKFKNLPNNDLCYLFIYNKEGEIVAVMKHTADKVVNLKTLEQDMVTNYKNCGAIWFQLK
ncbi:hypothetical protein [Prevotella sp. ne3005]|uniref:hypothetical protein n=1 Tax=Prevotella sp. ne3005 TaxID=1761887 RepID=UPI001113F7CA|nr:hypothetical protein [Prevotella sp. ne3005]